MKRWLRRIGMGLGVVAGLVVVAAGVLYAMTTLSLVKGYDVEVAALEVPVSAEAVERGRHIANTVAFCSDCHGGDLGGKVLIDDPVFGRIMAPNLTPAGRTKDYGDADWVRAIRHGVRPDGRALMVMPSFLYQKLGAEDLGAVIAYLKQLAPVQRDHVERRVGPMGRFAIVTMKHELLPASGIDHAAPLEAGLAPEPTAEYGRYLASVGCAGCHGEQMRGKTDAFHDVPDVTPHGRTAGWSREQFITAMRTGLRPDRTSIAPDKMPWPIVGHMTDDELSAVYSYLQQLDRRVALDGIER